MIKGMGLEGFKSFKNLAFIESKKINIFLGPNSSGKSSFLKSIHILHNSLLNSESSALNLDDYVGGFNSIVYGNQKNSFKFHFTVNEKKIDRKKYTDIEKYGALIKLYYNLYENNQMINSKEESDFGTWFSQVYKKYSNNPIDRFSIEFKETPKRPNVVQEFEIVLKNKDIIRIYLKLKSYYIEYNGVELSNSNLIEPYKFYFKANNLNMKQNTLKKLSESEIDLYVTTILTLNEIDFEFNSFLKNVIQIRPFRVEPTRSQYITNYNYSSVGPKGENVLSTVLGLKEEKKIQSLDLINNWLNKFDLATNVDIEDLTNSSYSLVLKNKYTDIKSNIMDFGAGTSQLLPIVIESIISPKNSVLVIEEPETHIHPNAQSKLADFFVELVERDPSKQIFIETHSMYLIRQIQILVAMRKIQPEDLNICYFSQNEDGSNIKFLELSENGQFIADFPKGFFDVAYELNKTFMEYI